MVPALEGFTIKHTSVLPLEYCIVAVAHHIKNALLSLMFVVTQLVRDTDCVE